MSRKPAEVEIPADVIEDMESRPNTAPAKYASPVRELIAGYSGKKPFRAIADVLNKHFSQRGLFTESGVGNYYKRHLNGA